MTIDGILNDTKRFFADKTVNYQGEADSATINGIKAAAGYMCYNGFDSFSLKAVCGAYAIVKGVQFIKDLKEYVGRKNGN